MVVCSIHCSLEITRLEGEVERVSPLRAKRMTIDNIKDDQQKVGVTMLHNYLQQNVLGPSYPSLIVWAAITTVTTRQGSTIHDHTHLLFIISVKGPITIGILLKQMQSALQDQLHSRCLLFKKPVKSRFYLLKRMFLQFNFIFRCCCTCHWDMTSSSVLPTSYRIKVSTFTFIGM